MPKRTLAVRNQDNEQLSTRTTRSASKKLKIDNETKENQSNPLLFVQEDNTTIDDTALTSEEDISTTEGEIHPTNKQYLVYRSTNANEMKYIVSKTARFWSVKYRKDLCHVCPSYYGLYIYNDFTGYGQLEIIENCLLDLTKTIFLSQQSYFPRERFIRKSSDDINYILAYRRLEALTILLDYTDEFTNIDDCDRFYAIMRVVAACYITILHGLLPNIMFNPLDTIDDILVKKLKKLSQQIPNFQQVLEQSILIGYRYLTIGNVYSGYTKILQIIYSNWLLIMKNRTIDFNRPSNADKQQFWTALKHASTIDPDHLEEGEKESFDFLKELRLYTEEYGLGGDAHDLRKWTRAERDEYSRDRIRNFWF